MWCVCVCVCMCVGMGGGGQVCAPHYANVYKFFATLRSYVLASFQQMTFKFGSILI